jgi:hypothetical protein
MKDSDTFAPTVSLPAVRMQLIDGAANGKALLQGDVENAFLKASLKDRRIILRLPPHWGGEKVQLYKSLYGLDIAPKKWYIEIANYLTNEAGWTQQKFEPGLFHKTVKGTDGRDMTLTLSLYVDDFIITGMCKKVLQAEFDLINSKYTSKPVSKDPKEGDPPSLQRLDVLGADVEYDPVRRYLKISCETYIGKILEKFKKDCPDFRVALTPCDPQVADITVGNPRDDYPIRELVGALGHLVQVCRPDCAF